MPRCTARLLLILSFVLLLAGCKVEIYTGLSEEQANQMLSTLLRHGIAAEKVAAGKNGHALSVEDGQLVQALQILKENSLPREAFKSMGEVFSGDGMISSSSEEQARMAMGCFLGMNSGSTGSSLFCGGPGKSVAELPRAAVSCRLGNFVLCTIGILIFRRDI